MIQASRSAIAHGSAVVAGLTMLATSMLTASAFAAAPAVPDGLWYTKNERSIIKVHPCAAQTESYCGTLVWLKDPNDRDGSPKVDKLNTDPAKRGKPLLGVEILLAMKADEDHWKGKAYNAEDGKTYDITFKVKDETADLRGCVLGFLCQTQVFTRAPAMPGGDASAADAHKHKGKATAHR